MKQLKLTLNESNYNLLHSLAYQYGVNYNTLVTWLLDNFCSSQEHLESLDMLYHGITKEGAF